MANYELRVGDTYPNIPLLLSDSSGAPGINLGSVTYVRWDLKGVTAPLITGYCAVMQVDITATASGSTSLTSVSPTTGYSNGATIYSTALGIASGTTIESGAGTGTLTLSAAATGNTTGTAYVNLGIVNIPLAGSNSVSTATGGSGFTQADTYTGECQISSTSGIQTVPNAVSQDFTILVDEVDQ